MGQAAISYPPLDVVIYITKFLWIEDIHALTAVSVTTNDMIEGETDLWPFLLNAALQRIISIPFRLDLNRTGKAMTKALIRRTCDHPTAIDSHILRKYKGPKNVSVKYSLPDIWSQIVQFEPVASPDHVHSVAHAFAHRRSVVSNNCFPCLAATAKVSNALLPFTKAMASPHRIGLISRGNNTVLGQHTATLSSVAYFESTIQPTATSLDNEALQHETTYSIGLAASPFPLARKVPGEDLYSFGYDSKSGHVMTGNRACTSAGVPYGEGDTVGCGVVYPLTDDTPGQIFFTKNGILQHKIPLVKELMQVFFAIAWFPVVVRVTCLSLVPFCHIYRLVLFSCVMEEKLTVI